MDLRNVRLPAPPRLPTSARHVLVAPPAPLRAPVLRDSTVLPPPLPPPGSRPLGLAGSRAVALALCGALALVVALTAGVSRGSHGESMRLASTVREGVAAR